MTTSISILAKCNVHNSQCDQIWQYLKVVDDKFDLKNSPNTWVSFGLF